MKAPSRKVSRLSCMALFLEPMLLKGKRQGVALGNARHRIDILIAQALDEALIVAGPEAQVLGRQPAPGKDDKRLEIGHAAQMRRLVERAEQVHDFEAIAAMPAIGSLGTPGRNGVHQKLAMELVATRPIGPAQLEHE